MKNYFVCWVTAQLSRDETRFHNETQFQQDTQFQNAQQGVRKGHRATKVMSTAIAQMLEELLLTATVYCAS